MIKGIKLIHYNRKKKVAEQRKTFVLLEVYRNTMTRSMEIVLRTKDSGSKKFAANSCTPIPFGIKGAWILTLVRWFFEALVHQLLSLVAFWINIYCPNNLSQELLARHAASSTSLDLVTIRHFHIQLFDSLLITKQKENYVYNWSFQMSLVRKEFKIFFVSATWKLWSCMDVAVEL